MTKQRVITFFQCPVCDNSCELLTDDEIVDGRIEVGYGCEVCGGSSYWSEPVIKGDAQPVRVDTCDYCIGRHVTIYAEPAKTPALQQEERSVAYVCECGHSAVWQETTEQIEKLRNLQEQPEPEPGQDAQPSNEPLYRVQIQYADDPGGDVDEYLTLTDLKEKEGFDWAYELLELTPYGEGVEIKVQIGLMVIKITNWMGWQSL